MVHQGLLSSHPTRELPEAMARLFHISVLHFFLGRIKNGLLIVSTGERTPGGRLEVDKDNVLLYLPRQDNSPSHHFFIHPSHHPIIPGSAGTSALRHKSSPDLVGTLGCLTPSLM